MRALIEQLEPRLMQTGIPSRLSHMRPANTHVMAAAITIPSLPPLPGDANSDGVVDFDDMTVVTGNWNHPGGVGDLNHDGIVNFNDMLMVTGNWGRTDYSGATMVVGGVLNVWQPTPVDAGIATWTGGSLYGPTGQPNVSDIHQGQVNDCYLLAAIGSLAIQHPSTIMNAIATDATGYVVTWHDESTGRPVLIHTSDQFSVALQLRGVPVWWEVLEKTYTEFRTWNGIASANSFSSIGFGFESDVWVQLGAGSTNIISYGNIAQSATAAQIVSALAAHHMVTWDTSIAAGNGLVANHVYIVTGVEAQSDGTFNLDVYQPWGFFQTLPLLTFEGGGLGYFRESVL